MNATVNIYLHEQPRVVARDTYCWLSSQGVSVHLPGSDRLKTIATVTQLIRDLEAARVRLEELQRAQEPVDPREPGSQYVDEKPARELTRRERHQLAADHGIDTVEDMRGEK
jgi:hypothetical protein